MFRLYVYPRTVCRFVHACESLISIMQMMLACKTNELINVQGWAVLHKYLAFLLA